MDSLDSPVGLIDAIDIVGVCKDGGIDTVIVCAGALDDSKTTLASLRLKIRHYSRDIASQSFVEQYGTDPVRIFVACEHEISKQAKQLIDDFAYEAARQHVLLVLGKPVV
jgi:hypothetical protein